VYYLHITLAVIRPFNRGDFTAFEAAAGGWDDVVMLIFFLTPRHLDGKTLKWRGPDAVWRIASQQTAARRAVPYLV